MNHHTDRTIKICKTCGKKFDWTISRGATFCSRECNVKDSSILISELWEEYKQGKYVSISELARKNNIPRSRFRRGVLRILPKEEYLKAVKTSLRKFKPFNFNILNKDKTEKLFNEWKSLNIPLIDFKGPEIPSYTTLSKAFRKFFLEEYKAYQSTIIFRGKMYKIGRAFEYRCRNFLIKLGFFVIRSPKSKGPFDLLAMKDGTILLVQCKLRNRNFDTSSLKDISVQVGGIPIVAYRERRRGKIIWETCDKEKIAIEDLCKN